MFSGAEIHQRNIAFFSTRGSRIITPKDALIFMDCHEISTIIIFNNVTLNYIKCIYLAEGEICEIGMKSWKNTPA